MSSRDSQSRTQKRTRESRQVAHRWTDADKRLALSQLVLEGGNIRRAASVLKTMGTAVPRSTLADWRRNDAALYAEVQREILPQIDAGLVEKLEQGIGLSLDNHAKGAKRLGRDLDDPEKIATRDVATANRNEVVAAATLLDKRQILMNRPSEIRETRSSADLIRELRTTGVVVEGDAVDVTDAELVQSEPGDDSEPDS